MAGRAGLTGWPHSSVTTDRPTDRRNVLASLGVATMAALAGCHEEGVPRFGEQPNETDTDVADDTEPVPTTEHLLETARGRPPIAHWIHPDTIRYESVDFARIDAVPSYRPVLDHVGDSFGLHDSMAAYPLVSETGFAEALPTYAGYTPVISPGLHGDLLTFLSHATLISDDDSTNSILDIERYTLIEDLVVLDGTVDEVGLAALSSVEERDVIEDFTLYSALDGQAREWPIAVTDSTLLFGFRDTFEDDVALLETAIQNEEQLDEAGAGDNGGAGREWLLEQCGGGAFTVGGEWYDAVFFGAHDFHSGLLVDLGVSAETVEDVVDTFLGWNVVDSLFVADGYEGARVSRTGIIFERQTDVPDPDAVVSLLADGATGTEVVVEENRLLLEAFWTIPPA